MRKQIEEKTVCPEIFAGFWGASGDDWGYTWDKYYCDNSYLDFLFGGLTIKTGIGYKIFFLTITYNVFFGTSIGNGLQYGLMMSI